MSERESRPMRDTFPRRLRLQRASEFKRVMDGGIRASAGPLHVYAMPNELAHPRLGLAISRRVGGAVKRNALKRRLRETFRHLQHDLPGSYDLVFSAKAHEPLAPDEYRTLLMDAAVELHAKWQKKEQRRAAADE
jgi:ribonuclease P protein component